MEASYVHRTRPDLTQSEMKAKGRSGTGAFDRFDYKVPLQEPVCCADERTWLTSQYRSSGLSRRERLSQACRATRP